MIELNNVTKIFPDGNVAISNINMTIEKGNLVVLLGPSGCGKSTLLRMINRMESISAGDIVIDGVKNTRYKGTKLRQKIGYVIQQIGLFPNKTVAENIGMIPKVLGWDKKTINNRVFDLLELMNLSPKEYAHRYPSELSGGQQQRIGVARALGADPEILLMDEPFGAIDPINRERIQSEFLKLQEKLNKTIIFVSHDINEAIKLADKIALFKDGNLVQYDSPEILLTQPANNFVENFIGTDASINMLTLLKVKDILQQKELITFESDSKMKQALSVMQKKHMKHAIITKQNQVQGYINACDLRASTDPVSYELKQFNNVLRPNDSLKVAISLMLVDTLPFLVVEDKGMLCGIVTLKDFQNAVLDTSVETDE